MITKHIHLIILTCCALIATGCKRKPSGPSAITASALDRDVKLSVVGAASVTSDQDAITCSLPGHLMVIEKERLLLDKVERAKVPATAKKFEIIGQDGMLTVTADGVEILKTPLK